MDNYLNISRLEENTPIFRFTTIERALPTAVKGINTLVSPRKWEDPFENIISNMKFTRSNKVFKHPLRDRVYGQCWTMTEETDATWRMYVPQKNGVRLKTTIRKLYQSLLRSQGTYRTGSCFIGKVEYKNENELESWYRDPQWVKEHLFGVGSRGQAESLLFKREAFRPEQEIRLIFLEPQNEGTDDYFSYTPVPSDFIQQITFDPRMDDSIYETYSSIFRKYGFAGDIGKSTLYEAFKMEIPLPI